MASFPFEARASKTYAVLAQVSLGYPPLLGRLPTCYSPVRRFTRSPKGTFSLDLHVLSTPPAFILSQDQTLQLKSLTLPDRVKNRQRVSFCKERKLVASCHGIRDKKRKKKNVDFFLYLVFKEPTHAPSHRPKANSNDMSVSGRLSTGVLLIRDALTLTAVPESVQRKTPPSSGEAQCRW